MHNLDSYQLKWIALFTMTMDHAYKMFGVYWIEPLADTLHIQESASSLLLSLIFSVGAVTIYIFMWFIAEGCGHTKDKKAYIRRLLIFGAVAEIPFQFMVNIITEEPLSLHFGFTNVMVTLALGAAASCGYQYLKDKGKPISSYLIVAACIALASILKTDYSWFGVIGIFTLYQIEDRKKRLIALTCLAVCYAGIFGPLSDILYYGFEPAALPYYLMHLAYALCARPLLSQYHGDRGKKMKYLFYIYYPLHMSILVFIYINL